MNATYRSWGRYPHVERQGVIPLHWASELPALKKIRGTLLPYGYGRSYGDSCLNEDGSLLACAGLDRFVAFDPERGILRCEAGVRFDQILSLIVPQGWFLPVSPGTKFVSVAGAIANDVHGKNHHQAGTFGRYVTAFELLRSDGRRLICNPSRNTALFRATVGGLGLTGLILWAEFKLKKIPGPAIQMETIRFRNLEEFFRLSESSDKDWEYTVSWVDCLSGGRNLGRGHFMRGRHSEVPVPKAARSIPIPFDFPEFVLNRASMRVFNTAYYHRQWSVRKESLVHYEPFFYPLDAFLNWNRGYGKRGFLQWQCVVPFGKGEQAIGDILSDTARAGMGSLLAVLKTFGKVPSPGLLSFPRPGITLALDFPFRGAKTLTLLDRLDRRVLEAGGRVYPAKDAHMAGSSFRKFFPEWKTFSKFIDPKFSSSFWRRVMA
jgi:FAD/FMN-containing dehydrogenase